MAKRWYVVHAYSGFEKHVKRALEERIKLRSMEELFGEILVPTEEVVEIRGGQKRKSERKFFPGYVLVQMEMCDDSWHLVKETPKVMGFIGEDPKNPGRVSPITQKEADAILRRMDDAVEKPKPKRCSNPAKWCGLSMDRLPTSMAWSRKSITRRAGCMWPCLFSVALPRWSWNSVRLKKPDARPGDVRRVVDNLRGACFMRAFAPKESQYHG